MALSGSRLDLVRELRPIVRSTRGTLRAFSRAVHAEGSPTALLPDWDRTGLDLQADAPGATLHKLVESDSLDDDESAADATVSSLHPGATADIVASNLLGEGGMGTVRLARQTSLARDVAVKSPHPGASARTKRALVQEAQILGLLEHPNIVPVHALGLDASGAPVLVMKRVTGVSWRALILDREHPLWDALGGSRPEFHLNVFRLVCNAAHFAHTRGIVHRDIKAENVMIDELGEVYLVDWGLALRVGERGSTQIVGTPSHMAPEMLGGTGSWITPRTDVYLLGATLHEALTREARHAQTPSSPPSAPPA